MIKVVAKFSVQSGKVDEFKKIAEDLIDETRQEKGNISYELYQDTEDSQALTFIEEWEDQEALEKHMGTKHFQDALPQFEKITTAQPEANKYKLVQ